MSSYTQLYVHFVWSTWERQEMISTKIEQPLHTLIRAKSQELHCETIAVGGMSDHIHLLARLSTNITIGQLVGAIKGSSAHAINHEFSPGHVFKWQQGYGAFTISPRSIKIITRYIQRQLDHHNNRTLIAELELS